MRTYKSLSGATYKVVGDPQRRQVYAWETEVIGRLDTTSVSHNEAQDFVNFVWYNEGRDHPPKVILSRKNARRATGCRLKITVPVSMLNRWILLHEAAHAFTSNIDGASDGHGPEYMRVYFGLLEKHMKLPIPMLMYTAKKFGLKVNGYLPA